MGEGGCHVDYFTNMNQSTTLLGSLDRLVQKFRMVIPMLDRYEVRILC